jgi:endonuclease/exonuclease/phosphatase family metal-dependent hydrolase
MGLVDDLPELKGAVGGSRIWTHKNGNSPNAARQELDFIFTTEELADEVVAVAGGIDDFPNAWDVSDHAPVTVDFE